MPKEITEPKTQKVAILRFCDALSGRKWYIPQNMDQLEQVQKLEEASIIEYFGGGTGWYPDQNVARYRSDVIIQIGDIRELQMCYVDDDEDGSAIHVGAAATLTEMETFLRGLGKDDEMGTTISALLQALSTLASPQVRNVATVGGNVAWTHPCTDLIPNYVATGCQFKIHCLNGMRVLDFDESFLKKKVQPGGMVMEIIIPKRKVSSLVLFFRKARRKEFDMAMANACFHATRRDSSGNNILSDVMIVFGGMEFIGIKGSTDTKDIGTKQVVAKK